MDGPPPGLTRQSSQQRRRRRMGRMGGDTVGGVMTGGAFHGRVVCSVRVEDGCYPAAGRLLIRLYRLPSPPLSAVLVHVPPNSPLPFPAHPLQYSTLVPSGERAATCSFQTELPRTHTHSIPRSASRRTVLHVNGPQRASDSRRCIDVCNR